MAVDVAQMRVYCDCVICNLDRQWMVFKGWTSDGDAQGWSELG